MPSEPFDPRTSTRTFRIAISDIAPSLFPRLMARVRSEAPGVVIDWAAESPQTLLAVAEEQMDLAFVASALTLPEGLAHEEGGDIEWATFVRADHPAIESWGPAAWRKWPHVIVQVGNALQSPVTTASDDAAIRWLRGLVTACFAEVLRMQAHDECVGQGRAAQPERGRAEARLTVE